MQVLCVATSLALCALSSANTQCRSDVLASIFDYDPDAWQLIDMSEQSFYLMFTSRDKLQNLKYRCVVTSKTERINNKKWQRKLFYSALRNDTNETLSTTVGIKKRNKCHVYEDAITVWNDKGGKEIPWTSEIVYADYKNCVLLKSKYLGYQVWVAKEYLEDYNEIPYLCVLLYEIHTGIAKYWIYDWETCAKKTSNE
ncbi:uncharacterized protein LOC119384819 isoform X1 [Rhipicephalus sanguineus]|uniref:uncharacterized protein LOC119384819 isoform X1 n=1 Tax=Rhipicephalus sanguineus TaxID=34632 RepID=UPI0020C4FF08|nr:uncharacterized protein LOC119384819 isoform X1 [Rhipicephalus sanguineus]